MELELGRWGRLEWFRFTTTATQRTLYRDLDGKLRWEALPA